VVRASDFVNNLLLTEDGNLRTQVFEENVRSFLGHDNPVNQSIAATQYDFADIARATGYSIDVVSELGYSIDGGSNGFTGWKRGLTHDAAIAANSASTD
jgi:hypothetical protein